MPDPIRKFRLKRPGPASLTAARNVPVWPVHEYGIAEEQLFVFFPQVSLCRSPDAGRKPWSQNSRIAPNVT